MALDATLSVTVRTHLLSFIISAFQSLDSGIVRKVCISRSTPFHIWCEFASFRSKVSFKGHLFEVKRMPQNSQNPLSSFQVFGQLLNPKFSQECAPLVSISIWHNLSSEKKRERKLDQSVQLRKAWRAAAKRYEAADDAAKPRLRFERSWLFTLILDFFNQLYSEKSKPGMC